MSNEATKFNQTDYVLATLAVQAREIANEGHNGWGNTMTLAAEEIVTLRTALATAQAERDAENAQVTRLTSELAFVRNEAAGFNTAWAFALERVESERDAALQRAENLNAVNASVGRERDAATYRAEQAETEVLELRAARDLWENTAHARLKEAEQAEAALAQAQAALVPFARLCHADGIELPDLSCDPHEWRVAIAHAEAAHQRRQQAGE